MDPLALIFVGITVFGITAHQLFRKWLLNQKFFSEKDLLVAQFGYAALAGFGWLLAVGPWMNTLGPESTNVPVWVAALVATTLANVVIQFANMRAFSLAEASDVSPISAMTPGLVVLLIFFLGERPSDIGITGIGVVAFGVYVHTRWGAPWREFLLPLFFWLLFRSTKDMPEEKAKRFRALRWAYTGAAFSTIGIIGDGLIARHGDMVLAVAIELSVLAIVYRLFLPARQKNEEVKGGGAHWLLVVLGGLIAIPFLMRGVGYRLAPIADIGGLFRLAIPLTVLGGWLLLGETKFGPRRMLTSMIIFAGVVMIGLDHSSAVVIDSFDELLKNLLHR